MSVRATGFPVVSTLQSPVFLSLVTQETVAALPVMAVAILCVWAAHTVSAYTKATEVAPDHESAPEPAPAHESAPEHTQAPELSPVLAPAP